MPTPINPGTPGINNTANGFFPNPSAPSFSPAAAVLASEIAANIATANAALAANIDLVSQLADLGFNPDGTPYVAPQ
jgi:hypothetical protein